MAEESFSWKTNGMKTISPHKFCKKARYNSIIKIVFNNDYTFVLENTEWSYQKPRDCFESDIWCLNV